MEKYLACLLFVIVAYIVYNRNESMTQDELDVKKASTLNEGIHLIANVKGETNILNTRPGSFLLFFSKFDCGETDDCFRNGTFFINPDKKNDEHFSLKTNRGGIVEGNYIENEIRNPKINTAIDSINVDKKPLIFRFEKHETLTSYFLQETSSGLYISYSVNDDNKFLSFAEKEKAILFTLIENK